VAAVVSLITASTLIAAGLQLARLSLYSMADADNLRLIWTALVLILGGCSVGGYFLFPPLGTLGILMLLLVWTIRGPIIRTTR
jgi:hypothetical protein